MLYVLDTSVAVKWFLPEPLSDKAHELLARFRSGMNQLVAPDLFLVEFGHVLRFHFVGGRLSPDDVRQIWANLAALNIPTVSTPPLTTPALQLMLDHRGGLYDAVFIALAQARGCSVVTADDKMESAYKAVGCISLLADLSG